MMKSILYLSFFAVFFALPLPKVEAESVSVPAKCAIMKFKKEYERSKAVFIGEVIKTEKKRNSKHFSFRVKKYWKGIDKKIVIVRVGERARYQAQFRDGREYLVFAKPGENGELRDFRCSRSRDISGYGGAVKDDLKELGKGKTCIDLET